MKNLFALLLFGATLFVGCSDDDKEGSTNDLSGMWAYTADVWNGQETSTEIVELYEIAGNRVTYWMFMGNESEIPTYKEGYLIGYDKSNFESEGTYKISVSDTSLTVGGLMECGLQWVNSDKLYLWEFDDPSDKIVWQRVKGYK